jgi:hypothetical protein
VLASVGSPLEAALSIFKFRFCFKKSEEELMKAKETVISAEL